MKKKLEIGDINKLARDLMFDLSKEEANKVLEEFEVLVKQMEFLETIDTEGVEPMVYPFEEETSFLREDIPENVLSQEDALKNAKRVHKGYILLPRVVK